jgi:hypothetical protein
MVTLPVARSGAMQVVLLGRASSPLLGGVGVVGGGSGVGGSGAGGSGVGGSGVGGPGETGGAGGGVFCAPSLPLSQPAMRKAKDNNIPVTCLA